MANSVLAPSHRYAVGGLFALALHQAQVHQARPLGPSTDKDAREEYSSSSSNNGDSALEDPQLWVHENSGLLHPVFRILQIDSEAWPGLEKIGGSSSTKHHAEVLLKLLSEEDGEPSAERLDQELALTKAVDAMMMSMEPDLVSDTNQPASEATDVQPETAKQFYSQTSTKEEECNESGREYLEEPLELQAQLSYNRKVTVLYELLSACLAHTTGNDNKSQKGYDARHRVALRLLATWLDFKWKKMEAMEVMVACSAMALMKQEGKANEEEINLEEGTWAKWKRGGIIGAAAVTGGTLLAVTGGLAAPAIAAGFSALAPTLGTLVPVIGASGFAAAASAAGSVAGSVAVAASFGAAGAGLSGTKMAKRIGSIDEFEFKPVGDNHNQGRLAVGILVSGLVFEEEDFVRPWKGQDNLERYALQWESKNLIAVSTAIQDWLTSRIAIELMKQGSMMTVLNALVSALAWPATLLQATDFIDNKWSVAVDRSDKAGKLLAEVLSNGLQGNRPVTLIGFSLGARVIFKCLQSLAETEDNAGLIERVVLLGAPIAIEDENWDAARKMVAGRFVNAYSTNDWTLGFAFRASLLTGGLAGIQPVDVPGIENVDVTELIEGHSSYIWTTQQILQQLELETYYPVFRSSLVELQNNEIGKDPEI